MNIKSTLLGLAAFLILGMAHAQDGWNWPTDSAEEAKARELNAAYTDYMKSEQFAQATGPLNWLLVNVPELNESIYINGVTIYKEVADAEADAGKKRVYQDSVMTIYETRAELFNNEPNWIENKAYYAYDFYKGNKEKLAYVVDNFEKGIELNGELSIPSLYAAYFDAVYRHNAYNKAYTPEEVLEKYDQIQGYLDAAEAKGADVSGARQTTERVLVAMKLIDCDFIENTMGPRLLADPTNEKLADQIFKYSVQYKCFSSDAFLTALELIDSKNPTFATSQVRAMRYLQNKEFDKAEPVLEKAFELAENDKQKAEVKLELARLYAEKGNRSEARAAAKEVASLDEEKAPEAWKLIGDLYMGSFNICKGGESRAKDYSIFIAAYNAYQRAGNNQGMANARARFPSKEELFTEGLQVGGTISTGCWIGETVTLATRD
ncbi:tetratricopeptide repeat protein [Algoriphagus namhaensis]